MDKEIDAVAMKCISEWIDCPSEYSDDGLENFRLVTLGIIKGIQIMADELKRMMKDG